MIITKSLFVDFHTSPQLARWKCNNKAIYNSIQQKKHSNIDGMVIGQQVEDAALQILNHRDITTIDIDHLNYSNRHQSYHDRTQASRTDNADIIYQAGILHTNIFCKTDLLVRNEQGTYDLREVKAKNTIRKKTKAAPLKDDMLTDISFQHYVLQQALQRYSGNCFFVYLNKAYVRNGDIDYDQLLIIDDVTQEVIPAKEIQHQLILLTQAIAMTKEELDMAYPYQGGDHLTYYGTPALTGSVRNIPRARRHIPNYVQEDKTQIDQLTTADITRLLNKKGEPTRASRYVQLRQQGQQTIINTDTIQEQFNKLHYPLYFYDYETIYTPIPVLQGSSPRQQVVVQYSCHRMDTEGSITHTQAIIQPNESTNQRIIDQLIHDLNQGQVGTYIVRYQGFECTRNQELAIQYPQHADALLRINQKTFDLMEPFAQLDYFDRRFHGSSSIKKVLPVLTDISYDNLGVGNGSLAAELLAKLTSGDIHTDQQTQITNDLLTYCTQDTRAMIEIYRQLIKSN